LIILKEFKANWNTAKALVIGDVMLDKWTHHSKIRMSPEAPVHVIKETRTESELGGAGNALRHLNHLSGQSHELLTVVGNDLSGIELQELCLHSRSKVHWIVDKSRQTTSKERFYIDGVLQFRKDTEDRENISHAIETELFEVLTKIVSDFDIILLSDYAKGVLTEKLVKQIKSMASSLEIPIVVDPGFGRLHVYYGCTVIKPNSIEWDQHVSAVGSEEEALRIIFNSGTQQVLVTQSSDGVRLITESQEESLKPKQKIEVVDVTGAGDSLAAGIALLIGEGFSLKTSLETLNEIGANTVRQIKTQLPGEK
jgi:D-beta-D-heptose 7-phosphate kinase/D-beta-D-heptose 1-phosphate adenosyltransferase